MVVAEVPMWVVHSSENVGKSAADPLEEENKKEKRAMESLNLLEGLGGTQKCAIYSIDVHPKGKKFATGGGDGTVRIWNSGALFSPKYKVKSRYKEGGAYESSGESSAGEDSHGATTAADDMSGSDSSVPAEEEPVHDLSSFVRRKKDTTAKPNQTSGAEAEDANLPMSSPTGNSNHHHHHGHHRLLCTLSAHTGSSVLAVRFSTNGQYLASAGDDAAVCIYAPASNGSVVQNNLDTSVEQWNRIKLGRGHSLDVVGLTWAPDDSHLVSCSLDSNAPIIVWKLTDLATSDHRPTHSNVLINPYKILGKGIHTSTVKGVTFDPAGTYLASSGDDPSVCVWRAHDDWGLEKRIDANSGIFRRWSESDSKALSSQSLFRRLSWSTDGAYICSTNAVVKNKHVASTISREGWAVSNAKATASGAANLVGHKQPVVACRHCPLLLDARADGDTATDDEPEYATLLALGDKRGFVTVWSTRRARPIFKIQCSETRCTVTDLAWGTVNNDIMLLVSLLDGQVVAFRFGVPDEIGNVLKPEEQARVFQMRYGIDLNDTDTGGRRLFVGENSGPKFIENALQYTLENDDDDEESRDATENGEDESKSKPVNEQSLTSLDVRASQNESRAKSGKKRIQPLLMSVDAPPSKSTKISNDDKPAKKKVDSIESAMEMAEKAATGAEMAGAPPKTSENGGVDASSPDPATPTPTAPREIPQSLQTQATHLYTGLQTATPQIPHSTDRIHSIELPVGSCDAAETSNYVADCTNNIQVPHGSKGSAVPCTLLSISRAGQKMYKDQIPGTSCSAIAACSSQIAVGTVDGTVQLYGTSPTVGWKSGSAFRSHPPFVFGRPIVSLRLHESSNSKGQGQTHLLVVAADGSFGVYKLEPALKLDFKDTIMPPMSHMLLASDVTSDIHLPKLTRIQLTETGRLILLLALHSLPTRSSQNGDDGNQGNDPSVGVGGSLQAFVYDPPSELWMRVADSRFVLSDFYSPLPSLKVKNKPAGGELSKLDDAVRLGASASSLKTSRRGRVASSHAEMAYHNSKDCSGDMATRSHCEDRLACAVALNSASEFEYWLSLYARSLSMNSDESGLRLLVDLLVGKSFMSGPEGRDPTSCWWLSSAPQILALNRGQVIKKFVVPEMSKNRALQRLTNEISLEAASLGNL